MSLETAGVVLVGSTFSFGIATSGYVLSRIFAAYMIHAGLLVQLAVAICTFLPFYYVSKEYALKEKLYSIASSIIQGTLMLRVIGYAVLSFKTWSMETSARLDSHGRRRSLNTHHGYGESLMDMELMWQFILFAFALETITSIIVLPTALFGRRKTQ